MTAGMTRREFEGLVEKSLRTLPRVFKDKLKNIAVVVEDWAVIGGQVGVGDKARIESGVVLGSGSGVLTSKIVRKGKEPFWGVPAQPLHEHLEQLANLARLPKLRAEVAELKRRLAELEAR